MLDVFTIYLWEFYAARVISPAISSFWLMEQCEDQGKLCQLKQTHKEFFHKFIQTTKKCGYEEASWMNFIYLIP